MGQVPRGSPEPSVGQIGAGAPGERTLPPTRTIAHGREQIKAAGGPSRRILVVDDDATGSQAVHDVSILFAFDKGQLAEAFAAPGACAFVLTNSRSLDRQQASAANRDIATAALAQCRAAQQRLTIVSRSDSTLRGHLFAEVAALNEAHRSVLGKEFDAVLLAPAYFEAGRVTVGDTHWARISGQLVPVGETEFARDATFGYVSSDLREFVAEKSSGELRPSDVMSINLDDIRVGGVERVAEVLSPLHGMRFVIVNGLEYADYEVVALAASHLEAAGKAFLYRTGPSFVPVLAGLGESEPLSGVEIWRGQRRAGHGLVVVGSHTALTNRQLDNARSHHSLTEVELDAAKVADDRSRDAHVADVAARVVNALAHSDVLLVTSRSVPDRAVTSRSGQGDDLALARLVSRALTDVLAPLRGKEPAWVIAKGGITSHDVALRGFGIQRALVIGQLGRGIISVFEPVSAHPGSVGMPYVVFAGNVGNEQSLSDAIDRLGSAA